MKKLTHQAPKMHSSKFKRTKIIATVGPATNNYEAILGLIEAGANGIRLNFSHGSHEERLEQIKWIRKASKELGKPVAIVQDLQGPKIRLGDFDGPIEVKTGQEITLKYGATYKEGGPIPTQYDLSKKVKHGERIYIFDGKVCTIVIAVEKDAVRVRVENDGVLLKRKGINLPDTDFGGDIITKKDMDDITFGAKQDIDYVALSFVQNAEDMQNLRAILKKLKSDAKIIAKIETNAATANLEEIVEASDAVMVARGDLAIETLAESVPLVQRQIINLCRKHAKPSIVATQMLASMTDMPEPTRAEVSDVATAVLVGADCVMLSDETANGKYPMEAVSVMKRIILYTQSNSPIGMYHEREYQPGKSVAHALTRAAMMLAEDVKATAMVIETKSGATARLIASHRPVLPIVVVTSDIKVAQQSALCYGVKSYVRKDDKFAATKLTQWLRAHDVLNVGEIVVIVSGAYPGVIGATDTIKVRVLE